jgi:hypothetical protein
MNNQRSVKQSIELLEVMSNKKTLDECRVLGKKPKKKQQPEAQEQKALFQWAKLQECKYPQLKLMFAIPNGGSRHPIEAKNLKLQGVKPGIPDIFLPVPKRCKESGQIICCGLWLEMKAEKGKLQDNQKEWLDTLNGQDYYATVVYGWEEAVKTILEYLET